MNILKLPVKFVNISEEELEELNEQKEKYKELGVKYEPITEEDVEIGDMYFNVDEIQKFNEANDGLTSLTLKDGWAIIVHLSLKDFILKLKDLGVNIK